MIQKRGMLRFGKLRSKPHSSRAHQSRRAKVRKLKFLLHKSWEWIHQSCFVVALCLGIITGVILALIFRINFFISPIWLVVVGLILVLIYIFPRACFIGLALVAGMILAFFRSATTLSGSNYIQQFYGEIITVTGVVDGDPESADGRTSFKLKNLQFGENKVSGVLYITAQYNNEVARSDTVILSGKMSEGFGIYAGYMFKPEIQGIKRATPGDLILNTRNWFAARIKNLIPEPEVNLGISYLLGMRSGLPDDLSENLRAVGLVHIVVASGAHLSILVEIARKLFGKISRFAGVMFSIIFIVMFMAMIGFTPSILRAGIMSLLTIVTWYVGRKMAPWRLILTVAAITLMIDPMFISNLGWLLSFASYAGIMILGSRFTRFCYGAKKPGFIAETIITTIAATMMTLPITLFYFGTTSLVSVLANLLILPTLPYAMGLVFLTGVVAGVPTLEAIVAFLATKILDFHIAVVEFFGKMDEFIITIPEGKWVVFLGYLVIFGGIIWGFHQQRLNRVILEGSSPANARESSPYTTTKVRP